MSDENSPQLTDEFTSELAARLAPDVLARFDRYVRINTQSQIDPTETPSTPGQLELGRLLLAELLELGLSDASQGDGGYVIATLPGTVRMKPGRVAAIKRATFRAILDEEEPRLTAIAPLFASLRQEIG